MAKEEGGKDKKPEEKKSTDNWGKNFKWKVVYNKDGIRVLQSADNSIPFKVVLLPDGTKKILPPKADVKSIDFTTLPDLDEKDLNKNVTASQLYGLPKVDNTVRQEFNNYTDWLKGKGYAGNPEMNHKAFSDKAFAEYKTEHPDTILTPEHFLPIQADIHNYRDNYIQRIKEGKENIDFTPAPDFSNVMQWAGTPLGSKNDGIVGEQTSQFKFPSEYMEAKIPENRIGFVPPPGEESSVQPNQPAPQPMQTGQGLYLGGRRVAELFQNDKQPATIKWRNDFGATGQETQIDPNELQKYVGTTNAFQSNELYKSLLSKAKSTAKK